jgi:hypothetical protein
MISRKAAPFPRFAESATVAGEPAGVSAAVSRESELASPNFLR